jgi:carbonic anhydrase
LSAARAGADPSHGTAPPHTASAEAHPHWTYDGEAGPSHWGELSAEFKSCQLGLEQAPVDLADTIKSATPSALSIDYRAMSPRIVNNGHTIQVNADPGSTCNIDGTVYDLVQFHFHHPSEHLLAGKSFDLECHFVHRSKRGDFAVIGVFVTPGTRHEVLALVFDAMPRSDGPEIRAAGLIDPAALMPKDGKNFRYMGSLTTPPCSEGITWTVFKTPIQAAPEQIRQFASLFPNNARPVQNRNRRFLIETN